LTLKGEDGKALVGLRAAVRGGSSSSVSGARTGGAQTRTVHTWAVKGGDGGDWVASAEIPVEGSVWTVTLAFNADQQVVDIHAQVRHQRPMYLSQQALVLRLSGLDDADVVDRAYRRVPAAGGQLIDAWTPKRLRLFASGRSVVLDAQAQSMQIAGQPSTVLEVSLEADHRDNHPLRIFKDCHKVYDAENVPRRSDRSPVPRVKGQVDEVSARLFLGSDPTVLPLRYPRGFRSALVFTDHADQARLDRMQAVMYGHSGPDAHKAPSGGFVGHGLAMTKTLFHRSRLRGLTQLSLPEYAQEARRLAAAGIELGPHSVGDGPDKREKTRDSLAAFQQIGGSPVWIDHQPATNCEALCSEGADPSSRYYLVDLLREFGYRYAWAGTDVREPSDGINLFDPERFSRRPAVLYRHAAIDRERDGLWLFSSLWRLYGSTELIQRYSQSKLDGLERDRGLHIAHTYLDSAGGAGTLMGKTILRRAADGYRLADAFDSWLGQLSERQAKGGVWVPGVAALAEHLVSMRGVEVAAAAEGVLIRSSSSVSGASFLLPGVEGLVVVDGRPLSAEAQRLEPQGRVFWLDLEAGKAVAVHWKKGAADKAE